MDENYKDPTGRARAATVCLALFMLADLVFGMSEGYGITVIDGFQSGLYGVDALERIDSLGRLTGGVFLLIYLLTVIFSARWIMRANGNAQARSDGWMTVSPGWNVGFFFIPFANLIMPFRGLRQTMQVSADPDTPEAATVPLLLRLWWATWLVMGFVGQISFRLSMQAETLDELRSVSILNLITTPIELLGTALFILVIWRITRLQRQNLSGAPEIEQSKADFVPA